MSQATRGVAIALVAIAATGCSGLEIYSNAELKGEQTGIKFYTPKPYLVVGRTPGDKTVEVKVVHLPDLENPRYAKLRSGIGFTKYTFTVNESGTLQTVNQETDMKLPETLSNLATLVKAFERKEAPGEKDTFEMYEVIVKDGKTTLHKVNIK
jgi:hypothetical protein